MSEKEQEQVTNQMQEEQKKKRKKIVIIILLLLLIIAAVVIFLIMKRPKRVMTEENYKQISEEMDEQVQEGYFETYMNTDWTFPNGASESTNAILGNSP